MRKILGLIAFIGFIIFLLVASMSLRPFGAPTHTAMDLYFIHNAQKQVSANNVVTSIVFDYRGFDTLGEATVLFTAVSGVLMALRKGVKR